MSNTGKPTARHALDGLPVHLQQALLIAASILRRMSEKRLDKPDNSGLVNSSPTSYGGGKND